MNPTELPAWPWPRRVFVPLLLLVLLIYGVNLGDGPLSDDELYLERAAQGPGPLLLSVTANSQPQMIRPWPALFWLLPPGPTKLPLLHLISLLLHAAAAALVARLAARRGASPAGSLLLGALFASLPLLTEAILWLSASFDLWATFWGLLALELALAGATCQARFFSRGEVGALAAFLLALFSKESVLLLPAVGWLLFGKKLRRRVILLFSVQVAASLLLRWWLFGGLGGYHTTAGGPLPLRPFLLLRNLFVQIPFRLLQPFREWAAQPWGLTSLAIAVAFAAAYSSASWGFGWYRQPAKLWRAPAALLVAALPLVAVLGVDAQHGNGRLLYFPAAVVAVTLGGAIAPGRRALVMALPLLVLFALAAAANAQSFRQAAAGKERLLAELAATQDRWPAGVLVQVDGADTVAGAIVWRNAHGIFNRLGLRPDVTFWLGHPALLTDSSGLGRTIFVVGLGPDGHLVDWTPCELELLAGEKLPLARNGEPAVVALGLPDLPARALLLYYWPPGGRAVVESSLRFLPRSGQQQRLRLPPDRPAPLKIRVDGENGPIEPVHLELLAAPESCRHPLRIHSQQSTTEDQPHEKSP